LASATTTVALAAPPAPVAGPRDPPAALRGAVPRAQEGGVVRRLPFPPAGPQPAPDSSTVPRGQGPRRPGHAAPHLQAGRPLQAARHGLLAMTKAPPARPAETDQPAPDSSTVPRGQEPRRPGHAAPLPQAGRPLQAARHGLLAMMKAPPGPPGRPAEMDRPGRPGPPVRMTAGRRSPADAAVAPARLRPGGRNGIRELLRSFEPDEDPPARAVPVVTVTPC